MSVEKRILFASILSVLFLSWYSRWIAPDASKSKHSQTSTTAVGNIAPPNENQDIGTLGTPLLEEERVFLESEHLILAVGKKSGAIREATLKNFMASTSETPLVFGSQAPVLGLRFGGMAASWEFVRASEREAVFKVVSEGRSGYEVAYSLEPDSSVIRILVSSIGKDWDGQNIFFTTAWERGDGLDGRNNPLEAILALENKGKPLYKKFLAPWKKPRNVPRGTLLASLSERYFCQSFNPGRGAIQTTLIPSPEWGHGLAVAEIQVVPSSVKDAGDYNASLYIGPRDYFYLKRAGFEKAFPIGVLGQVGLILLTVLNWLAGVTRNYGIAIILFSCLITCATAPFTILSFRSMKKMQQLKPQVDAIMTRYKEEPAKMNKEVFALYKQHRVSPLSGCLPMLLQFPIFIALFQAISHFIELRGRSLLWIKDLSLPDKFAQLPFSLPVIGDSLNLLPIIMAIAMFLQSRISQGKMASAPQENPATKMLSGPFMAVLFGLMFYNFPAGLVLYWLTNSLTSLVWYKVSG